MKRRTMRQYVMGKRAYNPVTGKYEKKKRRSRKAVLKDIIGMRPIGSR